MTMERKKSFIINCMFFGIWIFIVFAAVKFGMPALAPFVMAVVFSYLLNRPIRFLMRRLKLPRRWAAILVVLVFYSTVGLVVTLLFLRSFTEIVTLIVSVPDVYELHVAPAISSISENFRESIISMDPSLVATLENLLDQFVQAIGDLLSSLSVNVMTAVSGITSALPGVFVEIVLLIISTFFITIDYDRIADFLMHQLSGTARSTFMEIKEYVVGTLFVCIRSYGLIMSITFVELSIALSILRLENAVLIALLIALFDILPVLGTGGIMIPWMVIVVLQGNYSFALGLLLTYMVITVIRNIIEPKIVGKQIGLHPILTLSSMFLGVQLFGVIGLFGFPIGLSLLRYLNEKEIIKVYKPIGTEKK